MEVIMLQQLRDRLAVLRASLFAAEDMDERRAVMHDIQVVSALIAAYEK